jgi:hypothetical protein
MPLNRYLDNQTEDAICRGCRLLPTKPEAVPVELACFVYMALGLSELERGGAKFAYPEALNAVEWSVLRGLTRGRERAESLRRERERANERRGEKEKRR